LLVVFAGGPQLFMVSKRVDGTNPSFGASVALEINKKWIRDEKVMTLEVGGGASGGGLL